MYETYYGYRIEQLALVAYLLDEMDITPDDLKEMAFNFEMAFNLIQEEFNRRIEEQTQKIFEKNKYLKC